VIGALVFFHRWLGVTFCLLFSMWFASGIVMHFVPYPSFTAADRRAGLAPIDLTWVKASPSEALGASGIGNFARVRLNQRSDGPIYLISNSSATIALHAWIFPKPKWYRPSSRLRLIGLRRASAMGSCQGRRRRAARL
jgi:hypothetical protein